MNSSLVVGSIIKVKEQEGVVLFLKEIEKKNYAIVIFHNSPTRDVHIFEIAKNEEGTFFREENDEKILTDIFIAFIEEMQEDAK